MLEGHGTRDGAPNRDLPEQTALPALCHSHFKGLTNHNKVRRKCPTYQEPHGVPRFHSSQCHFHNNAVVTLGRFINYATPITINHYRYGTVLIYPIHTLGSNQHRAIVPESTNEATATEITHNQVSVAQLVSASDC